jgi:hypothetical protein
VTQVNPHDPPLHVAVEFDGGEHGEHDVPHELVLVSLTQLLLQSCVPVGQVPLQAMLIGMQLPRQSFCPDGQLAPHEVPSHVAVPPTGGGHALHDVPQVLGSLLLTQLPPQTWYPLAHCSPHL